MYVCVYVCIHIIGDEMSVWWSRYLLDNKMIHGDCLTVTGKTMAENLASVKPVEVGNGIIFPLETPIKETGHLQILYGNLVPYIHAYIHMYTADNMIALNLFFNPHTINICIHTYT